MAQLRAQRFAIVFLDIVLGEPGSLDGLAICQRLKHHPSFAGDGGPPKVVMVTGLGASMDKVRGTLAGCDAYLAKPLSDAELLPVLRQLDPSLASREAGIAPPKP
jgi:DNA-binding response OmpR family regulator